jgi:hypothetical protein
MVQVTWYDGTGRQLGQVTYSNLTMATDDRQERPGRCSHPGKERVAW